MKQPALPSALLMADALREFDELSGVLVASDTDCFLPELTFPAYAKCAVARRGTGQVPRTGFICPGFANFGITNERIVEQQPLGAIPATLCGGRERALIVSARPNNNLLPWREEHSPLVV